ncbi:MAG: hypothetical protein ACKOA8_07740, partial [Deltaproteobacteria bacterium]
MKNFFGLIFTLLISMYSSIGLAEHAMDPNEGLGARRPRPEVTETRLGAEDLRVYLALIKARKAHLIEANQAIMNNVDYAYWKIGALVTKGAIDGYLTALLFQGVGAVFLPKGWTATAVKEWVVAGGLQKVKAAGFDVGMLGISSIANEVLADEASWLYRIPIFGSMKVAYDWSNKFFSSPEILEENGRQIRVLMREEYK